MASNYLVVQVCLNAKHSQWTVIRSWLTLPQLLSWKKTPRIHQTMWRKSATMRSATASLLRSTGNLNEFKTHQMWPKDCRMKTSRQSSRWRRSDSNYKNALKLKMLVSWPATRVLLPHQEAMTRSNYMRLTTKPSGNSSLSQNLCSKIASQECFMASNNNCKK